MTQITQQINSLDLNLEPNSNKPNSLQQASLPLPLATPILLSGQIDDEALMAQIKNWRGNTDSVRTKATNWLTIGVDEVGRGPLYGSVVVAAVILPEAWSDETDKLCLQDTVLAKVADSKKLTEAKRERLFEPIKQKALAYVIVDVPAAVIDEMNILQATLQAMRLACEQLMLAVVKLVAAQDAYDKRAQAQVNKVATKAPIMGFKLLIDGNKLPEFDRQGLAANGINNEDKDQDQGKDKDSHAPVSMQTWALEAEAWVKGDGRHTAIAAASILAKVTRDRQLIADGARYPGYGLEKHKGYPTKAHLQAINELGVLPEHRRSYKPIQEALKQESLK
ncbi:ribonuclease HII [Psychrobacter lutiphocae]|uniref:ribonuclease HII n=1 Tax=Psychrobacter lutiphocae TaxID=540500 RepID=UPI00035C424A|nr:ribonuclease HII [Psychrobacter lutiphocae]